MIWQKKSLRVGSVFIILLLLSGGLLMYKGNDAIALAVEKKEGILTAEQVKVSFDSVGGRLINEVVKEAQEVKQGDIIMILDSTDVDLAIAKLKTKIAQLQAQIDALNGSIDIGFAKASTNEEQSFRQIDQQRASVNSARATYENKQLDYQRKAALAASGAISRSELDDAKMNIDVAVANMVQQQQLLSVLLAGSQDNGNTDTLNLPTIEQQRSEIANKKYDVENLNQQKQSLLVELQELVVKKDRLTLRAPEDGKILKILAKQGEMVNANVPVILLESKRYYYDIYISETQVSGISEGSIIKGRVVANNRPVIGTVRLVTVAPGFADLKMTREKGQADLSAFQLRIYPELQADLIPGMTIEVIEDEFVKR